MSLWGALTNPNHSHPQWMCSKIPGSPGLNRHCFPAAIYQSLFTNKDGLSLVNKSLGCLTVILGLAAMYMVGGLKVHAIVHFT